MGGIYFPFTDQFYFAAEGRGAYKNGKQIHCSKDKDLHMKRTTGYIQIMGNRSKQIRKFSESSQKYDYWHTEYGAGSFDAMLVAEGSSIAYFSPNLGGGIWDATSSYIILKESGCKVTNFDGKPWSMKDTTAMIAANPQIHKTIMRIIK